MSDDVCREKVQRVWTGIEENEEEKNEEREIEKKWLFVWEFESNFDDLSLFHEKDPFFYRRDAATKVE